jgi:hypothetical protein
MLHGCYLVGVLEALAEPPHSALLGCLRVQSLELQPVVLAEHASPVAMQQRSQQLQGRLLGQLCRHLQPLCRPWVS